MPLPHLKGSNVPSSASVWQDPQGSRPWVSPEGFCVFKGSFLRAQCSFVPRGAISRPSGDCSPSNACEQGPDGYIFAFARIPPCRCNLPLFLTEVMVPSITSALLDDTLEVTLITSPCSSSLKDRVEELKLLGWKE